MRSASNGMPCCFDIPEARRDPSLGFCDLCSERLRVKVETDAELSRLRAENEMLRDRLARCTYAGCGDRNTACGADDMEGGE